MVSSNGKFTPENNYLQFIGLWLSAEYCKKFSFLTATTAISLKPECSEKRNCGKKERQATRAKIDRYSLVHCGIYWPNAPFFKGTIKRWIPQSEENENKQDLRVKPCIKPSKMFCCFPRSIVNSAAKFFNVSTSRKYPNHLFNQLLFNYKALQCLLFQKLPPISIALIKSGYAPSGPSGRSLSRFRLPWKPTPRGWDTSPSHSYPQH